MKKIIITLGLISALSLSTLAQQPEGERAQRPQRPDPQAVATKMVADFDKDGNSTLNKVELGEAMLAMRANRGQGRPNAERPRAQEEGQRQRPQRPNTEGRDARAERPDRPDMAAMFMQRNDKNEDGELSKEELAGGLGQMNRGGRGQPNRDGGRPKADRPNREK